MRLVLPFLLRMTRQWATTVWRRLLAGRCLRISGPPGGMPMDGGIIPAGLVS
jgi:hypothetical protein